MKNFYTDKNMSEFLNRLATKKTSTLDIYTDQKEWFSVPESFLEKIIQDASGYRVIFQIGVQPSVSSVKYEKGRAVVYSQDIKFNGCKVPFESTYISSDETAVNLIQDEPNLKYNSEKGSSVDDTVSKSDSSSWVVNLPNHTEIIKLPQQSKTIAIVSLALLSVLVQNFEIWLVPLASLGMILLGCREIF
jgi:hypothetical protein